MIVLVPLNKVKFIKIKTGIIILLLKKKDETTGEIVDWNFYYDGGLNMYKDYVYRINANVVVVQHIYLMSTMFRLFICNKYGKFCLNTEHYQDQKNRPSCPAKHIIYPDFCEFKTNKHTKKKRISSNAGLTINSI